MQKGILESEVLAWHSPRSTLALAGAQNVIFAPSPVISTLVGRHMGECQGRSAPWVWKGTFQLCSHPDLILTGKFFFPPPWLAHERKLHTALDFDREDLGSSMFFKCVTYITLPASFLTSVKYGNVFIDVAGMLTSDGMQFYNVKCQENSRQPFGSFRQRVPCLKTKAGAKYLCISMSKWGFLQWPPLPSRSLRVHECFSIFVLPFNGCVLAVIRTLSFFSFQSNGLGVMLDESAFSSGRAVLCSRRWKRSRQSLQRS